MLADQSQQWCPTSAQVTVLQARGLRTKGKNGTNDAYAIMQVAKDKFSTSVAEKSVAPMWKEEASFDLPTSTATDQQQQQRGSSSTLQVHIMHRALVGPDKLLGQAVINLLELSEDKTRNKTEWYKLLNKAGKPDKDRGEVLLDIQFMRNNMTASMFDLSSMGDKPRSRLGKLKDKVRGKKKDGQLSETASAVVPSSFTQVLTDSEDEEGGGGGVRDGEGEGGDKEKKKKHKLKSLFSPKSNLHKNMSQSMSVLGPLPERSSSLSGSRSSGLNVEPSEGKKKFKFMTHKRSGSSDSKISQGSLSLSGRTKDPQSNLCINGSHVYNEEPQPRRSRGGSTFSLASSGLGSMEDLPRGAESSNPSLASADSFRALKQQQPPWSEGDSGSRAVDEEEEQEAGSGGTEVEGEKRRVSQMETAETIEEQSEESRLEEERIEEEKRRMEAEEELERRRLRMEEERKARQEARAREERERKQREEEEKRAREEEEERERMEEEEKRAREEEEERVAEERRRIEEEEERKRREEEEEEEERERIAEERRRIEEEEKMRLEEEKRRAREEEAERERIAEERRRIEEEERIREEEEERERLAEERRRMEEEEEEAMRMVEERKRREEEKKRIREEEERERIAEERRRIEEEEEEERIRQAELERLKMEEERRKMREEEEENRVREEREREAAEERKRIEEEEERIRRKAEMERLEAEERKRREEQEEERERERLAEERRRQEEEEMRRREEEEEEERFREEEEAMEREAAAERRREEEERLRKEEELRLRRVEEEERAGRMRIEVEEEEDDGWEPEKENSQEVKEVVMVKEEERQREEDTIRRDAEMKTLDNEEEETTTSTEEKEISGETLANDKEQSQWFEGRQEASKASREDQRSRSEHLAVEEDNAPSAERLAPADPFDDDEEDISSSSNPFEEEASSMAAAAAARTHRGAAIETAKVSAVKPSPPQRFVPSNPFLNPFESETEPSQQMDVCVLEKKRRAPLPPNNKLQTFPPESAVNSTINLAESRPSGLQSTSRATPLAANDMEESIGADGTKDFVRDKGPAPQPPGKDDPRKERSSETTSATKIKNSNSFPQRLVQIIAPVSRPASTTSEVLEGTSVATHNKGPAPRRPQCSSETKGAPPSSAADAYPKASGESNQHSPVTDRVPVVVGSNPFEEEEDEEEDKAVIPLARPNEITNSLNPEKRDSSLVFNAYPKASGESYQHSSVTHRVPVVLGSNPFEEDDEEAEIPLTRPDEITNASNPEKQDSSSSRYRGSSTVDHQDTTGNAKKKSSKTEHAPLPPARKTAVLSDRLGVNLGAESASTRHDGVVPDKRVVLPCAALSLSSHQKPLETPDTRGDDLSQMVPSGQITAVSHPPAQTSQTQVVVAKGIGEQAGGRWDVPASASRRPHPVKPLSPQEQQPASRQETRDKTTAVLCDVEDKIKKKQEDQPRPTGPYSQLTQEELLSLVAKQQSQLSERDGKISQLEKYIDALLVRVMEEKPSILMSLSSSSTV